MSSALTFCVEKGWIESNTIKGQINRRGVRREPPRRRIPTREEIDTFTTATYKSYHRPDLLSTTYTNVPVCPAWMRDYIALKMITGLRQGQLLAINLTEHWDGEVLTPPASKGGRENRYRGEGLQAVIAGILGPDRIATGPLFVNSQGETLTATAFKSAWRRAMKRFCSEEVGGERFHEHDIHKYVASEADTLDHAQQLLGHTDSKITAQVYRIGPQDVRVLK